mgnify:CR=1 FL=1
MNSRSSIGSTAKPRDFLKRALRPFLVGDGIEGPRVASPAVAVDQEASRLKEPRTADAR